jgi:hypothetical protein
MGLEKQHKERQLLKQLRKKLNTAEKSIQNSESGERTQVIRVRLWTLLILLLGLVALLTYLVWF